MSKPTPAIDDTPENAYGKLAAWKDILEQQLKDERAAREQDQACLVEALDVLQLLRDHQNGCPLPKYEKHWNEAMDRSQVVIDNYTPPPLLAELERLRAELKVQSATADEMFAVVQSKWAESKIPEWESLEQELAALKLKLEVARVVSLNHQWHLDYGERYDGEPYCDSDLYKQNIEALSQLNEFRDRPLAVPVALDARGNDTREIPVQLNASGVLESTTKGTLEAFKVIMDKLPEEEPCSECRIIGRKNCSEHGSQLNESK